MSTSGAVSKVHFSEFNSPQSIAAQCINSSSSLNNHISTKTMFFIKFGNKTLKITYSDFSVRAYRFSVSAYNFPVRAYRFPVRAYNFSVRAYRFSVRASNFSVRAYRFSVRAYNFSMEAYHFSGGADKLMGRTLKFKYKLPDKNPILQFIYKLFLHSPSQ